MRTKFQPPTQKEAPAQTIPSQPAPAVRQSSSTANPSSSSGPVYGRSPTPTNPKFPLDAWEDWSQPTTATAEQMEQLLLWLKPMPRCLITLRQMLESQQQRIDGMSTHLMTVVQELDTRIQHPAQNQSRKQPVNLNGITTKAIEISITVLLTTLLIQFSPLGLNHLNQNINQLIQQPARSGRK